MLQSNNMNISWQISLVYVLGTVGFLHNTGITTVISTRQNVAADISCGYHADWDTCTPYQSAWFKSELCFRLQLPANTHPVTQHMETNICIPATYKEHLDEVLDSWV